jgi:alpha-tubulin suppressor-like RCC1 family protein
VARGKNNRQRNQFWPASAIRFKTISLFIATIVSLLIPSACSKKNEAKSRLGSRNLFTQVGIQQTGKLAIPDQEINASRPTTIDLDIPISGLQGPCNSQILSLEAEDHSVIDSNSQISLSGNLPNCKITFQPAQDATGSTRITVKLTLGGSTNAASFNLTVRPGEKAPTPSTTANESSVEVSEDTPTTLELTMPTLPDFPDSDLRYIETVAASKGSIGFKSLNSSSRTLEVIYTPNANVNGSDTFSYKICTQETKPKCTSEVSITVEIKAIDDKPVTADMQPASMQKNTPATIMLAYTDPEQDKATSCAIAGLSHVLITSTCACDDAGICTVEVMGTNNYVGSAGFSFTVIANGNTSNSSKAILDIADTQSSPGNSSPENQNNTSPSSPSSPSLPPTSLAFDVQPSNAAVGATITPAIKVKLKNGTQDIMDSGIAIAVQLSNPPGGITLGGTLTASTVNGVATFNNLAVNAAAAGLILSATSAGLTSVQSNSFAITVVPPPIPGTLDSTSSTQTPTLSVSNLSFGVLLEVLSGANDTCTSGIVVNSKIATSSSEIITVPVSYNGAAPTSFRIRTTDAQGNVSCSSSTITNTPSATAAIYPPEAGNAKFAISMHACTITNNSLYCWGRNNYRQIGDGLLIDTSIPKPVSGFSGSVTSVAVAESFTCAIKAGALYCWGSNSSYQSNMSYNESANTPTLVFGLEKDVTSVSVGGVGTAGFGCAIRSGALYCWGANGSGQVEGGMNNCGGKNCGMHASSLNSNVQSVSVGSNFVCAIQDATSRNLYCIGNNTSGQLGDTTTTPRTVPTAVAAVPSNWTAISADPSGSSICGINDSKVYCWGANTSGQLGTGDTTNLAVPTLVPDTASFVNTSISAISVNNSKVCAIKNAGLFCWGSNSKGEMYNGTTTNALTPQSILSFSSGVTSVAVGYTSICAVQNSVTKCWGWGPYGEMGGGIYSVATSISSPMQSVLSNGISKIEMTSTSNCAIQSGGLKCWGGNSGAQLGDGTTIDRGMAATLASLDTGVTNASLTPGNFAIKDGTLWSWGSPNTNGTVGNNTTAPQLTPTAITGDANSPVTAVEGTDASVCAIKNGGLLCWGNNSNGQVGNSNTTGPVTAPYQTIADASGVTAVSIAGTTSTSIVTVCAVNSGSLWCWGNNSSGQVGDGTTTSPRTSPYQVSVGGVTSGVTAAQVIGPAAASGTATTCAL